MSIKDSHEKGRETYESIHRLHLKHDFINKDISLSLRLFFSHFLNGLKKGRLALDLGCGPAQHAIALAKKGFRVLAIDYAPSALKIARKSARKAGVINRITFICKDILDLRFEKETFDVIIDSMCFHHIRKQDWKVYWMNVECFLKRGGYYILSAFTRGGEYCKSGQRCWTLRYGQYSRFFTKKDILHLLKGEIDLLVLRKENRGQWGLWHCIARRKAILHGVGLRTELVINMRERG